MTTSQERTNAAKIKNGVTPRYQNPLLEALAYLGGELRTRCLARNVRLTILVEEYGLSFRMWTSDRSAPADYRRILTYDEMDGAKFNLKDWFDASIEFGLRELQPQHEVVEQSTKDLYAFSRPVDGDSPLTGLPIYRRGLSGEGTGGDDIAYRPTEADQSC